MAEEAPHAKPPLYKRIPGAVWGLVALGAGMALGSLFPDELGFIGTAMSLLFRGLAWLAPYIIFFTIAAAIVDMQRSGKGGRFAFWVTIAFTAAGLLASLLAILMVVPIFQLPWGAGGASRSLLSGMSFEEIVLAHATPSLIAVLFAAGTMILFGKLSKLKAFAWFTKPTMTVVRDVGVKGIGLVGRGIKTAFPALLFGIGIYIPTGIARAVTQSSERIGAASLGMDSVVGTNPVALYFLTVWIQVVVLFTFLGLVVLSVCWYTKFSVKRFLKEYLLYVYPFAWATSSSAASIPVNLERTEALGVRKEVRDFIIPLGATVNLDGAIMACFIITPMAAILTGYTPTLVDLLLLVIPIKLVTMGVPGIPGGIAAVVPPLVSEILPIPGGAEGKAAFIAIWFGFSVGLSDQFRTGVNTATNGVVALLFERLYPKHFEKHERAPVAVEVPVQAADAGAPKIEQ